MVQSAIYTATLSGKSALVDETFAVLAELDRGHSVAEVKAMVLEEDLLGKLTTSTRKSIWDHLHTRYLVDEPRALSLARMVTGSADRRAATLVLFYELCRSSPVLRDAVLDCVYPRYSAGYSTLGKTELQQHFDAIGAEHPEIAGWSPQTREKIVSNILTILRDFGLLAGTQTKQFTRLYVPLPAFVYVVYRLADDGVCTAQELLAHPDWRLFLLEPADVERLLLEATAAGYCTYKARGDVYILDLRYPSLEASVESLTREV